ncbi:short-subunit dehydrogenase [Flavobacterium dankookense]|uniref:Short-subunit dehydrogenase n=1 Tax=Flavobacterium dankookense TaxID=706186 RepID=A0A4R6Q829_9FLAO|nr:short-subunit dehydrogenase [Flavobacterium dankookense]
MSKNIIITGTSRGIGYELALQFANAGHQVLAISRKTPQTLIDNQNITCIAVDLGNENELVEVEKLLSSSWKKVDIIIHNAGSLISKPFAELSQSDFENVYKVNVFGVANLTRIALPYLQKGSHVVTISSMGGIQGSMKFPGLAAYSSSKGAVITLSELLAEEYKEQGIAFNVLALGAVNTEMLQEAFPGYEAPISATEMADYIFNFALTGNKYHNGKIIQVSSSTP